MSEKTGTGKGRKGNGHKGKERRKGAGTLEKRGRVYIARWTVDGKRYSQSTGTNDKREAEAKLAEFVAPFQLRDKAERLEAFTGKLRGVQERIRDFEESLPALRIADAWDAFIKSPNRKDTAGAARFWVMWRNNRWESVQDTIEGEVGDTLCPMILNQTWSRPTENDIYRAQCYPLNANGAADTSGGTVTVFAPAAIGKPYGEEWDQFQKGNGSGPFPPQ